MRIETDVQLRPFTLGTGTESARTLFVATAGTERAPGSERAPPGTERAPPGTERAPPGTGQRVDAEGNQVTSVRRPFSLRP